MKNRAIDWAQFRTLSSWMALALALLAASGCHRRRVAPPVAPQQLPPETRQTAPSAAPPSTEIPVTPITPGGIDLADRRFIAAHQPILSEIGYATWYRSPYPGRRAANGQVLDDHALTAAQRTLPMGTLVVVTNLETGQSSPMRISDRGPFVADRMIDLTIASAKAVGIYREGLARVRMDVYRAPKPISTGGRWCVQIGAFHRERDALRLKKRLLARYPGASVIEFPGERSYWVRIRPPGDDRTMAETIARHTHPIEGAAYLTRLD